MFLLEPDVKRDILNRFPDMEEKVRFVELGSDQESSPSIIGRLQTSLPNTSVSPIRISLVAPYYFLIQDIRSHPNQQAASNFQELRSFANNYTEQGFKIKECKPVLNRVLCHLAMMSTERLNACPFLTKLNGVYTVDLSFIPEKYRLDVKRAEKILNRSLSVWLTVLEARLKQKQLS